MAKHLIILGHGEYDPGAIGAFKTEREHLEDLAKQLKIFIKKYDLPVVIEDERNVYKRNAFYNYTYYYKGFETVTELHFNSDSSGKATGGEILFAEGLEADELDKRFEEYLRKNFGFRRYVKSDWYQQTRVAKQVNLSSYRLVEICFCNNPEDIKKFMGKEEYHAEQILEVILNRNFKTEKEVLPEFETTYIIQLGAFNNYDLAQKQLREVHRHIPDAFIRKVK